MTEDTSAVLVTLMRLEQTVTAKLHEIDVRLAMLEHRVEALDTRASQDLQILSAGIDKQIEIVRAEARRDTALIVASLNETRAR